MHAIYRLGFYLIALLVFSNLIYAAETADANEKKIVKSSGVVKLSPHVRVEQLDYQKELQAKLNKWQDNFADVQIVQEEGIANLPRVISNRDGKVMSMQGDDIYVSNLDRIDYKKPLAIYRLGTVIRAYPGKKQYGYSLIHIGDIKLKKFNVKDQLSLVTLTSLNREIMPGDKILIKNDINNIKINKNTNSKLTGQIVGLIDGIKNASIGQSALISIGKDQGISKGNILSVVATKDVKRAIQFNEANHFDTFDQNNGKDVVLPEDVIGKLLIYKTYNKLSLGLVIEEHKPILINQLVKNC